MPPDLSVGDEAARLAALQAYNLLDTPPEPDIDDLTRLVATICDTPIALVSLSDAHRQWFKSHIGLNQTEFPRELAFCPHGIQHPDTLLIIPDTRADERF